MDRSWFIARMQEKGYNYKWLKYSDKQIYCMYERLILNKKLK